jgi:hypothetical protein
MPRQFSGAYFSGATNISLNTDYLFNPSSRFKIDTTQIYTFAHLPKEDFDFDFHPSKSTIYYSHNSIGFAWICKLALFLFGNFLPPIESLKLLQLLVHMLSCLWVVSLLINFKQKIVFGLLYAVNPLISFVVTYPYYYFWTVIPVIILIPYFMKHDFKWGNLLLLLMIVAGAVLASRTIILPIFIALGYFIYKRENSRTGIFSLLILTTSFYFFWSPNQKNLPFTAYIGLGAYSPTILPNMDDEQGCALAADKIESWRFNNCYYQDNFQKEFSKTLTTQYFEKAKEHPLLIARNALLNLGGAYSIGYLNDYSFLLRLISSLIGFVFIGLLFYKKMYSWLIVVFINCAGFIFYYPPIQIYMFSNYILLVLAFIRFTSFYFPVNNINLTNEI